MQPKDNRKQSHNLSREEIKDLQYDQISGDEKMIKANRDSSQEIQAAAKHMLHATIEALNFDQASGEKLSTPITQVFYPEDFDKMEIEGAFKGKTVNVIHDPRAVSKAADSKIDAAANSDLQNQTADKPLDEMDMNELRIQYADLYKEKPNSDMSKQDLRDAIEDKLVEIRGEEIASKLNEANEAGKGDLNDGVNKGVPTDAEIEESKNKASKAKGK